MNSRIKGSYTCSSVPAQHQYDSSEILLRTPRTGDVGVFRVKDCAGKYLKDTNGNSQYMWDGDLIMATFGPRYATSQYEAHLPTTPTTDVALVGRGGVVAEVHSQNSCHGGSAIPLELVAYVTDQRGRVINTRRQYQLPDYRASTGRAKIILSVGSAMDSGKTTTAAYACAGLERAGYKTAFIKLTGTAFPKDPQFVYDRGSSYVTDFSRAGFPSTFKTPLSDLLRLYQHLVDACIEAVDPDFIIVELADGILQEETGGLLRNQDFMGTVSGTMLSCGDSLGTLSGLRVLRDWGIEPCVLSGLFSASELLINEVIEKCQVPVVTLEGFLAGKMLGALPGTTNRVNLANGEPAGTDTDVMPGPLPTKGPSAVAN